MPLFPAELIDHDHVGFVPAVVRVTPVDRGHDLVAESRVPRVSQARSRPEAAVRLPAPRTSPQSASARGSRADFMRALREHKRPNGSAIDEAMPRGYGQMSDEELQDIFTYLRTVPATGSKTKRQM